MKTLAKWLALLGLMSSTALATPTEEQKACDGGDAKACLDLGVMYGDGDGVEQSHSKAVELFKKVCDGGNALGCSRLGWMYQPGLGVEKSTPKAIVLFNKACDLGDKDACDKLK